MKSIVIAGYARSPFTLAKKGGLVRVRPDDIIADVVRALVERTGVDPNEIEDLILGCAFPEAEQGLNMARLVALHAGLPLSVGGATVNRFCGSSMHAIHIAAGQIQLDAGEAFICAGVESMTRIPMGGYNPMPTRRSTPRSPAPTSGWATPPRTSRAAGRSPAPRRRNSPCAATSAQPPHRPRASSPTRSCRSRPAGRWSTRTAASGPRPAPRGLPR